MYLKNINKKKKIIIIVILVMIIVGFGIIVFINDHKISPSRPVIGGHRYLVDINALRYDGTVKSTQAKSISLNVKGKQVDFNVAPRVSVFNVSESSKGNVLQVNNTVAVRFITENNAINKAQSISKLDTSNPTPGTKNSNRPRRTVIDNNVVLVNGDTDKEFYDVIGDITEINGSDITIRIDVTGESLIFDTKDSIYLFASMIDLSSVAIQTQAKIWAREVDSRYDAIFIAFYQ